MNYIFLDIDGVMNNQQDWLGKGRDNDYNHMFCDEAWQMLSDVCKITDAKIILSSSWRLGLKQGDDDVIRCKSPECKLSNKLLTYFDKYDIKLVGLTTNYYDYRGKQIQVYVKQHLNENDKYVVLDDEDCDIRGHVSEEQMIKTEFETGLLPEHCNRIIEYFNKN